jgi:glycosyltransferase involved in cell wall biosynthesis
MDIFGIAMTFVPMPKILFISHDATRTGAPIVFLHQLKWLRENTNIEMCFLLLDNGPLIPDFEALGRTWLWKVSSPPPTFSQRVINRATGLFKKTPSHRDIVLKELDSAQFDMIYSNTVASHEVAARLKKILKTPWISHIHEMPYSIEVFYKKAMTNEILSLIDHVVIVSQASRKLLLENYPVKENQLKLIYECVPTNTNQVRSLTVEEVKEKWNAKDHFIVGGSGVMSWRKGIDLFINLSRVTANMSQGKKIKFVWVGELKNDVVQGYLYECQRLGVEPAIVFTGATSQPNNYFQAFDIFTLTSREDPFPLVCLEAAALGKPVLCFEDSGGIPELINNGGGSIIPYLNLEAFATEILKYANEPILHQSCSEKAKLAVDKYDVKEVAPHILSLIHETIST